MMLEAAAFHFFCWSFSEPCWCLLWFIAYLL